MGPDIPSSIRSLLLLTNPSSRRATEVRRQLESCISGLDASIQVTWKDVFQTAEHDSEVDRAVIVGGDGTVNLGLSWLNQAGIRAPVALIPAGTGNNLARGLGLPLEASEAIKVAFCTLTTRHVDAIGLSCDGARTGMMLQVAATRMPAYVASRFDRLRHLPLLSYPIRWIGDSFYRLLALQAIATNKNRNFKWNLNLDGEVLEVCGAALFFGNEGTIGGGFTPCPRARIDDGLLDVCLLPTLSFRKTLQLFKQVSNGTHLKDRDDIFYRQCRTVQLKQAPCPFLVDGDIRGNPAKIELECLPGIVELVLPEITRSGQQNQAVAGSEPS